MKHSVKITALLLVMFLVTQLIGLAVINKYAPPGEKNVTLPYGMTPPENIDPWGFLGQIVTAIAFAVVLMFLLMSFRSEFFLRLWFFLVVTIAIAITLNAAIMGWNSASIIAIVIALPLAFLKIYRQNIIVHNFTELLIYPGIAVIFVPLLNLLTISILLVLISIYDMYAVWHAGFMQKMAKYQIQKLKVFSGFFVPYLGKKERAMIAKAKTANKNLKNIGKKIKVNVAILGGGDVVFPIIFAGVIFRTLGLIPALAAIVGATAALAFLFAISKKGKFYPAMPFISAGCFAALALIYLSILVF